MENYESFVSTQNNLKSNSDITKTESEMNVNNNNDDIYNPNNIPKDIMNWIMSLLENPENDVLKLREEFYNKFPHLKDNLDFNLASNIDYEFNNTIGVYWMEAYSNPKRGDYVNIFGKERWVKESGIFTFRVIDYDTDDDD